MQVWVILNKGFFVSAYSTREKAYEALVRLRERGIVSDSARVMMWTLDVSVN